MRQPMRGLCILLILLSLTATGLLAQSDVETETIVTPGGMQFTFPAIYDVSFNHEEEFTLSSFASGNGVIITVTTGQSAREILADAPDLDGALTQLLDSLFAQYDPTQREPIALFNGFSVFQPARALAGRTFFVAFETGEGEDKRFVLIQALSPTARANDLYQLKEPLVRMLESVTFDVEPPELPEEIQLPALELRDEALIPAEMPEGSIIFNTDIQIELPDGWSFADSNSDVYDSALLQAGEAALDAQALIITSDPSQFLTIGNWRDQVLRQVNTQIAGGGTTQTSLPPQGVPLEGVMAQPGTEIEVLENASVDVLVYFINLNDRAGVAILAEILTKEPDRRAEIVADLETMARSAMRFVRESASSS
ncbi:MAG: hypothetical protein IPK19_16040 [Chloroflexi bacterium]|nr:hypothetical protein [Chloroflexota bacterium]